MRKLLLFPHIKAHEISRETHNYINPFLIFFLWEIWKKDHSFLWTWWWPELIQCQWLEFNFFESHSNHLYEIADKFCFQFYVSLPPVFMKPSQDLTRILSVVMFRGIQPCIRWISWYLQSLNLRDCHFMWREHDRKPRFLILYFAHTRTGKLACCFIHTKMATAHFG